MRRNLAIWVRRNYNVRADKIYMRRMCQMRATDAWMLARKSDRSPHTSLRYLFSLKGIVQHEAWPSVAVRRAYHTKARKAGTQPEVCISYAYL